MSTPAAGSTMLYLPNKLVSHDRVERHFAYLIALICALTSIFILLKPSTLGAPMCTVLCIAITLLYIGCDSRYSYYCRPLLFVLLLVAVGIYYDGTNVVNRARYAVNGDSMLYDESLLALDSALLSWVFPLGQLALALDTNSTIGVTSGIGPYYAEVLQLFYVSYYVWGNAVGVWFMYHYYRAQQLSSGSSDVKESPEKRQAWRRVQMFLTAWSGTFMLNFFCNLVYPAVSPRIFLKQHYVNEDIHGIFLCDILRAGLKLAAHNTYSAFPSGHCGLSWVAALVGYRARHIIPRTAVIALNIAAALISLATIVMRYHYFVDFLGAFALVAVGTYWGGWYTDAMYQTLITQPSLLHPADDKFVEKQKPKAKTEDFEEDGDMIELIVSKDSK